VPPDNRKLPHQLHLGNFWGTKQAFKKYEIVKINAPRFEELTVFRIIEMIADLPEILKYLPSDFR
jgi:hypothetical protein